MKLIVGLGNPGKEYENTRHNIGYIMLDKYAQEKKVNKFSEKFNGLYAKIIIDNDQILLLKPLSYMNLSGQVVKQYVDYYKIKTEDILIIHDDLDLPCGKIKMKAKGSCGGHNGIRNIIDELKIEQFSRLKIGIGKNNNMDTKDYVLGKFTQEERRKVDVIANHIPTIIDDFIFKGIEYSMSKYNGVEYETN